jgi:2,4-dienoyl-CoA reductase-like NADH-dependent reductase (Old Yellow Enzyme family)
VADRVRIVREIVSKARDKVDDFPILIKVNCTDYLEGGIDFDNFPELALEVQRTGVDAIEVSGGTMDCLVRTEEELGFRPVPIAEAHTRIGRAQKQSYFLRYIEAVDLDVPVILVGGNRDIERLEGIVQEGHADYIGLCRPLISEPGLPNRWLEGRGSPGTDCISCNSCLLAFMTGGLPACVLKQDKARFREMQAQLALWVDEHRVR